MTYLGQRENMVKQRCKQIQLNIDDIVREWNMLPRSVVQCTTVTTFKLTLIYHLLHLDFRY